MDAVSSWLRDLGLEGYAQAFAENDVDFATLPRLTEADLAEIGVRSVGHRRKLARAIAELAEGSAAEPAQEDAAPAPAPEPSPAEPHAPAEAERRRLTVLYCDLAADEKVQPEELRELVLRFHETCAEVTARHEGTVANFYGSRLLAYFGWPRALEDGAERAVRAARELVRRLARDEAGTAVGVRASLATGEVVVGEFIHEGPAQQQSAVGLAPNLGARLLDLAPFGDVVVDEATVQLLPRSFVLESLGRHAFKGVHDEMLAYRVVDERRTESRFDARRAEGLPAMVGRDQELELMLDRWRQARAGEGQAVLVIGEAGIGKSRLVRALLDACAGQPHARVRWQCSPYHSGSALWPVIQRLSLAAGLQEQDSTDDALDKLEAQMKRSGEAAAVYASLMGLNGALRYGPLQMTPLMLRERTLELMVEQLHEMAEEQPLLVVIEDAHWVDPSTLELLERCLAEVERSRMMVVVTSRPDRAPDIASHPSVTRLSLARLTRASVQGLVERLGGGGLGARTLDTIIAQTDGVPLFVEEVTKAVLESGEAVVPASLYGSLMSRLDRVPEAKEVAQIAACIGRTFDYPLLAAVAGRTPQALDAALASLAAAGLLYRHATAPAGRYSFKHALVRDAAYDSLLRGRREKWHARIFLSMQADPSSPAELLAWHAQESLQTGQAVACWQKAGADALAKSAYQEAAGHFRSAIALVQRDQAADAEQRELPLRVREGYALVAASGYGHPSTVEAFERARVLSERLPPQPSRLSMFYGLWACQHTSGRFDRGLQVAEEFLASLGGDPDSADLLFGHRAAGSTLLHMGRFAEARMHLETALALYDAQRHGPLATTFGHDPGAAAASHLGTTLSLMGLAHAGAVCLEQASRIAVPPGNAQAHADFQMAVAALCRRDVELAERQAVCLAEVCRKYRAPDWGRCSVSIEAWTLMERGQFQAAADLYPPVLAELQQNGTAIYVPFHAGGLARAQMALGHSDRAIATLEPCLAECDATSRKWCLAELYRIRGDILMSLPIPRFDDARRCLEHSLAIARSQGARLWELRAATSFARLLFLQGCRSEAHDVLAAACAGVTGAESLPDFQDARSLMTEFA